MLSADGPTSSTARLVAIALCKATDSDTLSTFIGAETLAEFAALSERAVRINLQLLEREGWLVSKKKGFGLDNELRLFELRVPSALESIATDSRSVATYPQVTDRDAEATDPNAEATDRRAPYPDSSSRIYPKENHAHQYTPRARAIPTGSRAGGGETVEQREQIRRMRAVVNGMAITKRVTR